jgi:hypothetical protein
VLDSAAQAQEHEPKVRALREEIEAARTNPKFNPKYAEHEVKRISAKADRAWITELSYWWSVDGIALADITVVPAADIAVGRLDPYPAAMVARYPRIKDPTGELPTGRSLCRLGFPFNQISPRYDPNTGFDLGAVQFTFFPLDGIYTRALAAGTTPDGKHPVKFIEISTPGIRGQSGGPVFDVAGDVWGIQSRTQHIPLGFSPEVDTPDGRKVVEHQVINLGMGVHPETLISILRDRGIRFEMAP